MADIGLGKILLRLLKMAIKSSLKAEASLDILIEQLSQACPSEDKIEQFIVKKNRINNSLTIIQKLITTTDFTTKTADKIIKVLDTIIKLVKSLPIPTSPIPIPINVVTIASDALDTAKNIIESGKGVSLSSIKIISIINDFLQKVQDKLNEVELLLQRCIEQLPEDQRQDLQTLLNTTSTDSSNPKDDKIKGEDLLAKLQPNSNDPLFYRGFRLQIEQNPNNPLETIPQRRVVGIQAETDILTVATDFSFASTTEVLVNEAKFLIDKWWITQTPVTSNIDLATIKILDEDSLIPEIEIEEDMLPSPVIEPPALPIPPQVTVPEVPKKYYTSKQSQDLIDIANKTGVSLSTIEQLNSSELIVGSFYKNDRKARKRKPKRGSRIRYQ